MIDGWMVKSLSATGRAELIRSVLHNILAYWDACMELEGYLRPKAQGDLDIRCISDSRTWKWICSSKNEVLMCMTKKMGNMRDTSLLYDCWIPGIRLVDCIQQNSISAKVHERPLLSSSLGANLESSCA